MIPCVLLFFIASLYFPDFILCPWPDYLSGLKEVIDSVAVVYNFTCGGIFIGLK
jgi:hypothetical protein